MLAIRSSLAGSTIAGAGPEAAGSPPASSLRETAEGSAPSGTTSSAGAVGSSFIETT